MKKTLAVKAFLIASSIIHPLLFAVFPVVFLYTHNMVETSVSQIMKPMLFSALGALLLWTFLTLLLKSTLKAGLATTVFVFLFLSYGRFYDLLVEWNVFVPKHAYLFPAAVLVWGYCVYFIAVAKKDFRATTRILNIVAVVLISLNLLPIAFHEVQKTRPASAAGIGSQVAEGGANLGEPGAMPDIYYIILDEYAHPSTMLEYYDYDNSKFIDELTNLGFYVASNSTTMYSNTNWSLAASLNMEYIPAGASHEFCFDKMADNTVANNLKSLGYTYVYYGVWFDQRQAGADIYYNFYGLSGGDTIVSQFSRTLWNTTMALPFYDYLTRSVYAGRYQSQILDQLECLKTTPAVEGPKFVFTHIICPHAPFVFGPNGERIDPIDYYNYEDKQFYLGQYRFITEQIKAVVTSLLANSTTDPIIILQSDHGLRGHKGTDLPEHEWRKILNAYYLPYDGKQHLYDSISPVNSFRVIFNHYFGTDYDLLQDPQPAEGAY